MPTLLERLAEFTAAVRCDRMSADEVAAVKRLVLDTLGCALGAVDCAPARLLRPMLRGPGGPRDRATPIGGDDAVDLASAILHNGTLVRYLDFMDVYWARDICHPSENIPVALACAQAAGCSGAELIEAIALAYEVQVRMADAFSLEELGLHHASAAGIVAPLIMARLWRMPPAQAAQAAALGGFRHLTHASLVRGHLSMAKAIAYAAAAADCVQSTRWAAQGFTGPLALLEGLGAERIDLSEGSGAVRRVSLKQFPVQYTLQSPIEAALRLRAALGVDAMTLQRIQVEVPADVCRRTADPAKFHPDSRETADHSMPCCVAMALLDGQVHAAQFERERWKAPDVQTLMQRIRVDACAELEARWPGGRPVRITATLQDGTTRSVLVEIPLGDACRPMSDEDVRRKFQVLAAPVLSDAGADAVARQIWALEGVRDLGALARQLRPAPHQ